MLTRGGRFVSIRLYWPLVPRNQKLDIQESIYRGLPFQLADQGNVSMWAISDSEKTAQMLKEIKSYILITWKIINITIYIITWLLFLEKRVSILGSMVSVENVCLSQLKHVWVLWVGQGWDSSSDPEWVGSKIPGAAWSLSLSYRR